MPLTNGLRITGWSSFQTVSLMRSISEKGELLSETIIFHWASAFITEPTKLQGEL